MKIKEFKEKVAEVLKREPMIGCTEEEEIRWKMKEIMRLGVGKGIEEIEKFCSNKVYRGQIRSQNETYSKPDYR